MQIEIAGIPGSGKSTVAQRLHRDLRSNGVPVKTPLESLTGRWLASLMQSTPMENRLLEFMPVGEKAGEESAWDDAAQLISTACSCPRERRRLMRSLTRKQHTAARARSQPSEILLIDEGVVHFRWMLMARLPRRLMNQAAKLEIGLPDILVWTQCEPRLACERVAKRGNPPFRDRQPEERRQLIYRAAEVAALLTRRIAAKTIVVPVDTTHSTSPSQVTELILWHLSQRCKSVWPSEAHSQRAA